MIASSSDSDIERRIVTGFIVSEEFIRRVRPFWRNEFLESPEALRIVGWCLGFFDQYGTVPNRHIEDIYIHELKAEHLGKAEAELIERILARISDDYERGEQFNAAYLFDRARTYFRSREIIQHSERMQDLIERGDVDAADEAHRVFKSTSWVTSRGIDVGSEEGLRRLSEAFTTTTVPVVHYPGALGVMLNPHLVRDGFVGFQGPEKRGKCISGDQLVLTSTGEWCSIRDLVRTRRSDIVSFDEESNQFVPSRVSEFYENGLKPVYRIKTRTGRTAKITLNHPLLTPGGWRDLSELSVGDYVATPKKIPIFGDAALPEQQIRLLAYFIADGCLGNPYLSKVGFTKADPDIQRDFVRCVESMGCCVRWDGIDADVFPIVPYSHTGNHVRSFLYKHGLMHKRSYEKSIPVAVFRLNKNDLRLFLSILITCDGWVNEGGEQIGFAVANEKLARQVQWLLTRFGIVSKLSFISNEYRGAWIVSISDYENFKKFGDEIGFCFGKKEKYDRALEVKPVSCRSFLDKFPSDVDTIGTVTGDRYLGSQLLWDELVVIEYIGLEETYDLTVPDYHNFVAENILVHNTFLLLDIAVRALRQKSNVAFFQAGDLTEGQFLRRIGIHLAGRSDQERYCREHWRPIGDCVYNQINTCDRNDRNCKFGVFDASVDQYESARAAYNTYEALVEAAENQGRDYSPCDSASCTKRWPAIWLVEEPAVMPLNGKTAARMTEHFFKKYRRRFKLATYPSGLLDVGEIESCLDEWERADDFVPDLIVVDYADLMHARGAEFRHQQNEIWKNLRSLSQKQHALVVTATQSDAASYRANSQTLSNYSEDKRKYAHVTAMFALNQSPDGREQRLGVMRISEMVIREGAKMGFEVTVLQDLWKGRAYLESFAVGMRPDRNLDD